MRVNSNTAYILKIESPLGKTRGDSIYVKIEIFSNLNKVN